MNREISYTPEFDEFYQTLDSRTKKKLAQVVDIIKGADVIASKFVKKLVKTELYEARISTDNEYRVILFTVDHDNIMQATQVIFLTGFIKKATKDYDKQIEKANKILQSL